MNRFVKQNVVLILIAVFTIAGTILAAPGDPDTTFGNGGTYIDLVSNHPCYGLAPRDQTLQADGKILVVGFIYNRCQSSYDYYPQNNRRVLLRRYKANGMPDNGIVRFGGFGMDGFAVDNIPDAPDVDGVGYAVMVQPDGKIVVAGYTIGRMGMVATVWRFTTHGELDPTFNNDGVAFFPGWFTNDFAVHLALSAGKVLVAGYSQSGGAYPMWLRRLNADGSLDLTFGTNGKVLTGVDGLYDTGLDVFTPTGEIAVSGRTGINIDYHAAVAKFTSSGQPVTAFGVNGKVELTTCTLGSEPVTPRLARDLRFQSNGELLITTLYDYIQFSYNSQIFRLTSSGGIDPTFGDPGLCFGTNDVSYWLRVLPNDSFLSSRHRFLPDGGADATYNPIIAGNLLLGAEAQPADGKIVYLSSDWILNGDHPGIDTRVRLTRVLP